MMHFQSEFWTPRNLLDSTALSINVCGRLHNNLLSVWEVTEGVGYKNNLRRMIDLIYLLSYITFQKIRAKGVDVLWVSISFSKTVFIRNIIIRHNL